MLKEKLFSSALPVVTHPKARHPTLDKLPGGTFDNHHPSNYKLTYNNAGNLELSPGDYIIPVMTYCLKANSQSPNAQIYSLNTLNGTRANILKNLFFRAPPFYSSEDIQILTWSLQSGLKYEELTHPSQNIVDNVLQDFKSELQESYLVKIKKTWDQASNLSNGSIPSFDNASDEFLNAMGETGIAIKSATEFKKALKIYGNDFSALSASISTSSIQEKTNPYEQTRWSQLSKNVYARFITYGHFQEIGFLQIRVLNEEKKRRPNSENLVAETIDIASLVADPISSDIQPLSFSPIYGYGGVILLPAIYETPVIATLVLGTIIAAETVNWNAFFKLIENLDTINTDIKKIIEQGYILLNKAHDELEKPARDAGVITGKSDDTVKNKNKDTRQYTKPGSNKELSKDFEKLPGEKSKASDGTEIKTLPDGSTAVKRPSSPKNRTPTLEIQPPQGADKLQNKIRIKVRYAP